MPAQSLRIRWAPKLRREWIRRLYEGEACGLLDGELAAKVGYALYQRCQSILMVTEGRQVYCPNCETLIECPGVRWARGIAILCPSCGWNATYGQYRDSWRHQELMGHNALAAFRAYLEHYPRAQTASERMLLIDQLIHAFHWSVRRQRSHVPVANNLIEGGLEEVLAFLDDLAYGPGTPPALQESRAQWKRTLDKVADTFPFVREKLRSK